MKILNRFPPNYGRLVKKFPFIRGKLGIVFTFGDKLYAPGNPEIPEHLLIHEETHKKQQAKYDVSCWWNDYIDDPVFRYYQELEAYRNQYKYIKENMNRKQRRKLLKKISKDLSGGMYGNLVSKKEAKKAIKKNEKQKTKEVKK